MHTFKFHHRAFGAMQHIKSPAYTQKSPTHTQKSHIHTQKSPTYSIHIRLYHFTIRLMQSCNTRGGPKCHFRRALLYIQSKEPYTYSKEPYTYSKEPYTYSKEPYMQSTHSISQSDCRQHAALEVLPRWQPPESPMGWLRSVGSMKL